MSEISVANCISDLLFEQNQLVLPGLGLFRTSHKASNIDQIQGVVEPPSKEITFNKNITADDGVLNNFIQKKYQVASAQSTDTITNFVNDLKDKMKRKEIVTIPDVGRLYLDFEKNLQFLPERVNYNKDSFGLPSLNFSPELKAKPAIVQNTPTQSTQKVVAEPTPTPPVTKSHNEIPETVIPASPNYSASSTDTESPFFRFISKALPFILGLGILVIAIFGFFMYNDSKSAQFNDKLAELEDGGKINTKPNYDKNTKSVYEDEDEKAIMDKTNEGVERNDDDYEDDYDERMSSETDNPTTAPGTKTGIIIVGGFSSERNADKLVKQIQTKGYSAYTDLSRGLTRVGVEFGFRSIDELYDMHKQLKREFNDGAWILQPVQD